MKTFNERTNELVEKFKLHAVHDKAGRRYFVGFETEQQLQEFYELAERNHRKPPCVLVQKQSERYATSGIYKDFFTPADRVEYYGEGYTIENADTLAEMVQTYVNEQFMIEHDYDELISYVSKIRNSANDFSFDPDTHEMIFKDGHFFENAAKKSFMFADFSRSITYSIGIENEETDDSVE